MPSHSTRAIVPRCAVPQLDGASHFYLAAAPPGGRPVKLWQIPTSFGHDNLLQGPRISRNPSAAGHCLSEGFNLLGRFYKALKADLELFLFSSLRFPDNLRRFSIGRTSKRFSRRETHWKPGNTCQMAQISRCSDAQMLR